MIDLHHHCLPDVDDGPREWDEAVEMCRTALEEGIDTIVATPHVLRGRWRTYSILELQARLDELQKRVGAAPRLLLGSEYFFSHDAVELLAAGNAIVPLAGSRYVLIELAANSVPPMFEQPLYRMQLDGWTPVIAHPERNIVFQRHPELLASYIGHGAKTQVTLTSLTGEFGPEAKRAAHDLVRNKSVHFVATDAHNMSKRTPRIAEAATLLRQLAGESVAEALMVVNPLCVVEKRPLSYDPEPVFEENGGFLTRLRSFFQR
ncbi:MAG TPA: CpsB/CapC family capsule biosynthesis tyrosine phosphatase [Thermoanaerobaculia bacterium]|jgi:protein-tyrosine phosphatase|nr:CpsB/CapC family capsule biosynthesis tyrosine phosphatase [Thermoanaerobaculia bacterium]